VNGAIEGLTRALALELGPHLRINCLSQGFVDTERFDHMDLNKKKEMLKNTGASLPLQRVGKTEEAADAVHFLLSNGFTTGVVLDVDGGHQIRQYASPTSDPYRKSPSKL
jgi:NAD(P)-dependent dehydrogenase (short-subunit alcohol dehydrogenase family)